MLIGTMLKTTPIALLSVVPMALLLVSVIWINARKRRTRQVDQSEPSFSPEDTDPCAMEKPHHTETMEEEDQVANALSREELDTLLGDRRQVAQPVEGYEPLYEAGQAVAQALCELTGQTSAWSAGNIALVPSGDLARSLSLPNTSILLVVEARVPGGSAFVATKTITACRLDEIQQPDYIPTGEEAFSGWRRTVEHMLSGFYQTLVAGQQSTVYPCAMQPRRWDPAQGGHGLGVQQHDNVLILPFRNEENNTAVYMLLPEATLTTLVGQQMHQNAPVTSADACHKEDLPDMPLRIVGDIPLEIAVTTHIGRLPIRSVAEWRDGVLVPVNIQPGQVVELRANGQPIAKGRLVACPDGSISAQISAVLPLAPDAG